MSDGKEYECVRRTVARKLGGLRGIKYVLLIFHRWCTTGALRLSEIAGVEWQIGTRPLGTAYGVSQPDHAWNCVVGMYEYFALHRWPEEANNDSMWEPDAVHFKHYEYVDPLYPEVQISNTSHIIPYI